MHSFTDAQLIYGYDGFKGVYEWFLFTLQYLIKSGKRVIIKGHPNIFDDDPKHITKLMDKELFTYIVSRYGSDENIFIIDRPISNYGFLSSLDRSSVILVSHHGNSIVEGAAIGFKSISSSKSLWGGEFNISNVWNNRAEYSALLSMKHDELMSPSPDDVSDFVSVVYCNDVGFYGDKFWQNIVAKEFKCTRDDVRNNIAVLDGGVEKHTKVAHEISKNISERVVV